MLMLCGTPLLRTFLSTIASATSSTFSLLLPFYQRPSSRFKLKTVFGLSWIHKIQLSFSSLLSAARTSKRAATSEGAMFEILVTPLSSSASFCRYPRDPLKPNYDRRRVLERVYTHRDASRSTNEIRSWKRRRSDGAAERRKRRNRGYRVVSPREFRVKILARSRKERWRLCITLTKGVTMLFVFGTVSEWLCREKSRWKLITIGRSVDFSFFQTLDTTFQNVFYA